MISYFLATLLFSLNLCQSSRLLQYPYEDGVQIGPGIDILTGEFKEIAIIPNETIEESQGIASDKIKISTISNTKSIASSVKANADFDFEGWGAKAQGKFAGDSVDNFKFNSVIFQSKRIIDIGYQGLDLANPPSLTQSAKDFLVRFDEKEFYKRYGSYFILGVKRGASATINLQYDRTDNEDNFNMDGSLNGSFSGFGTSIKSSGDFKKKVEEKYGLTNQKIYITFKGTNLNGNSNQICKTIEEASQILEKFNTAYGAGAGIYFVLAPYTLLRDFQDIMYEKYENPEPYQAIDDILSDALYQDMVMIRITENLVKDACSEFENYVDRQNVKTKIFSMDKKYQTVAENMNDKEVYAILGEAKELYSEVYTKYKEFCQKTQILA